MIKSIWVFSLFVLLGYAYESYIGTVVMAVVGFGVARAIYQSQKLEHKHSEKQRFDYFNCYFVLLGRMCYLSTNNISSRDLFLTQLKLFNFSRLEENNAVKLFESGFSHTANINTMLDGLKYILPTPKYICVMVFRLSQVEEKLNTKQRQLLIDTVERFDLSAVLMIDLLTEFVPIVVTHELMPFFKTLELSSEASFEEVKLQYRRLVKKYHPDKTGNIEDDSKVQNIIKAYEVLKVYTQKNK